MKKFIIVLGFMGIFGSGVLVQAKESKIEKVHPVEIAKLEEATLTRLVEQKVFIRKNQVNALLKEGTLESINEAKKILLGLKDANLCAKIEKLEEEIKSDLAKEIAAKEAIQKETVQKEVVAPFEVKTSQEEFENLPPQEIIVKKETPVESKAPQVPQAASEPVAPVVAITNQISLGGNMIPLVNGQGLGEAPNGNVGAYWLGSGSTTDGTTTHIIGHNPGAFSAVMYLGVGSAITVWDASGNSRTYTVYQVLEVDDNSMDHQGVDRWNDMMNQAGESISVQTCIDDNWNRILLAK